MGLECCYRTKPRTGAYDYSQGALSHEAMACLPADEYATAQHDAFLALPLAALHS
ncbi:hypothetical protein BS17DRAFT_791909 [Gyrodon lividus]|nr:hypothetical protein BS17DRAFT_791960 [Gyrodon lividus]KAF9218214.1 hypothetical protein BS17DRAFT_791909 [Gyrodon lividus]